MIPIIGDLVDAGVSLFKSYFPPDLSPEQKAKLAEGEQVYRTAMASKIAEYSKSVIESQKAIIVAEAQGESWMQKSWRPITMLSFVFIIVNNYILYPYITLFGGKAVALAIPPDLWELIKLGLGGYVVGRSLEKGVKAYKGK